MADATRTVGVRLEADTRAYQQKMNAAVGPGSPLGKLGALAAGATVAAGAAVAAFAAKSVTEFASLEKGMNEVFTLMPGMSQDAMGDMTQDVQDFAKEMGVLPDDIVPALYDSISAGVPKDNVFAFLETAQELAVGGVSDLNTAVDGLSSATNAYGVENLTAADAADIMFTGVKQGKTTIDELSKTVSETAPIAASLGVSFVDTTASLAAMTAQGEPSQKAATKLRQMMAELSDSTKGAGKTLKEITGQDFPAFVAGGGTMQEAITLIADDADSKGKRIADSFGSIEAGMAATMLTSDAGRESMNKNMDAMADRSGATSEAFGTMDQGIARTWERMKASLASFMTEIGERLGPGVSKILAGALDWFNGFAEDTIAFLDHVMENWNGTWDSISGETDSTVGRILAIGKSLWQGIEAVFEIVVAAWNNILKPMWEAIAPAVEMNVDMLLNVVETSLNLVVGILETVAALLQGDFAGAWDSAKATAVEALSGLADRVDIWWTGVSGTFNALVEFVNGALDRAFGGMLTGAEESFTGMQTAATEWWNGVKATLNSATTFLTGTFTTAMGRGRDAVGRIFVELKDRVTSSMETLFGGFGDIARSGLENVATAFQWMHDTLLGTLGTLRDGFVNIAGGMASLVRDAFGNVVDWLTGQINGVIGSVNGFIEMMNSRLEITLPTVGGGSVNLGPLGSFDLPEVGGWTIDPPDIPSIPMLGDGGIAVRETLAVIGEAGPEAVVPLDRLGSMGGRPMTVILELDRREIARIVAPAMVDDLRLKTGLAGL